MHPELFDIKGFTIYTYGPIMAFGFLMAFLLLYHIAVMRGEDLDFYMDTYIWVIVFGLLGAKLLYNAIEYKEFFAHPLRMMNCRNGGLVWYGGMIMDFAFIIWYSRKKGMPMLQVLDSGAAPLALGLGIGRWGCLMGGCCYGKPAEVAWAITYPVAGIMEEGVAVHPTPIYASLACFLIAVVIYLVIRKGSRRGVPTLLWLTLYPIARFIIELYRGDVVRGFVYEGAQLSLSTSQFIGILVMMSAIGLGVWIYKNPIHEIVQAEVVVEEKPEPPPKKKPGKPKKKTKKK